MSIRKTARIKNNVGISIIRQGREIDFSSFGIFGIYNQPEHRWWGCEISFDSELDEVFGISNNKQYVDLKPMSKDEMKDYEGEEVQPLWMQLYKEIDPTLDKMLKRNSEIRDLKFAPDENEDVDVSSDVGKMVDEAEKDSGEDPFVFDESLTDDEKKKEAEEELKNEGLEEPSDEQIQQFLSSNVRFRSESRGRTENFMTYSYAANVLIITLNKDHSFYDSFVKKVFEDDNERIAFQLLLTSLVKSTQELSISFPDAMDLLFRKINNKIYDYMIEYNKSLSQD